MSGEFEGPTSVPAHRDGRDESVFESARKRLDPELLAAIEAFLDGDDEALPAHSPRGD